MSSNDLPLAPAELATELANLTRQAMSVISTAEKAQQDSQAAATQVQAILSELALAHEQIKAEVAQVVVLRERVEVDQATAALRSAHLEDAGKHATQVRASLDAALAQLAETEARASTSLARARQAEETAAKHEEVCSAAEVSSSEASQVATKAAETAKAAASSAKRIADTATTVDARVAAYETELEALVVTGKAHLETIVGLLPGATSVGLASAFDQRRQTFTAPAVRWGRTFLVALLALMILAGSGLWSALHATQPVGYDDLLRLWLGRLPVAAALVWLAMHASREAALAKRLEEDYGYKAAVAASLQGFYRPMLEAGARADGNLPLAKLCTDTLQTLGSPPGRIYDRHKLTVAPSDEVKEAVSAVMPRSAVPSQS